MTEPASYGNVIRTMTKKRKTTSEMLKRNVWHKLTTYRHVLSSLSAQALIPSTLTLPPSSSFAIQRPPRGGSVEQTGPLGRAVIDLCVISVTIMSHSSGSSEDRLQNRKLAKTDVLSGEKQRAVKTDDQWTTLSRLPLNILSMLRFRQHCREHYEAMVFKKKKKP